jgi:hypothetical protein
MVRPLSVAAIFFSSLALAAPYPDPQFVQSLDDAWTASKWTEVESLLNSAWKSDPAFAKQKLEQLIKTGDGFARPLAAAVYAKHAPIPDLAALAKKLPMSGFHDERRLLIRSIGPRAAAAAKAIEHDDERDKAIELLKPFVDDQDLTVSAAAILSLADLGRPEAIGLFIHKINDVPAIANNPPDGDHNVLSRAMNGALRTLAPDLKPKSVNDIKDWWIDRGGTIAAPKNSKPKADAKPGAKPASKPKESSKPAAKEKENADNGPDTWNGQKFYPTDHFHVFYRIGSAADAPTDSDLAFAKISESFESAAIAAEQAFEPVVGPVHTPVCRLFFCDATQFSAKAKNAFFAGVTGGNEIVLKAAMPKSIQSTLCHEYIHYIHQSSYANLPRWVAEGLATSYSQSGAESNVRGLASQNAAMRDIVDHGAFTEMLNWNSGGSTDSKEGARYATAHLCIDYLRFGGFGAADTRIAFLLGRISRREQGRAAIEAVYGLDIKDLDQQLNDWAGVGGEGRKGKK